MHHGILFDRRLVLNNIFFFLLATFDARDTVMFFNFPSISEFTMCFWIKLDESWTGVNPAPSLYYHQKDTLIWIALFIISGEIELMVKLKSQSQQGHELQR